MAERWRVDARRTVMKVVYTICGAFGVGYWVPRLLAGRGGEQIAMVLLAAMVIPYGALARSVLSGFLQGLAIGLWGGLCMAIALIHDHTWSERAIWVAILGSAAMCSAVATVFAWLAVRRAERLDQRWR